MAILGTQECPFRCFYNKQSNSTQLTQRKRNALISLTRREVEAGLLDKRVVSENPWKRIEAAKEGIGLKYLVYDKNLGAREAVAKSEYGRKLLKEDESGQVRRAVRIYEKEQIDPKPDLHDEFKAAMAMSAFAVLLDELAIKSGETVVRSGVFIP